MADQISSEPYDLSTIDRSILTPVIRDVCKRESIEIIDWNYSRVHGGAGNWGTEISDVYRFTGTGRDLAGAMAWSVILKVVGTAAPNDDPYGARYWKREVLAYQSGQLTNVHAGLVPVPFWGTITFSETVIGMWLEDLVDAVGKKWPLEQYGIAARHLGQFNGYFLMKSDLPSWPWLSRGWLKGLVNGNSSNIEQFRHSLDESRVRRWFLDDDAKRLWKVWEDRELFFTGLDRLPQTLLHRDAFKRNLFAQVGSDGEKQTVAIDWAFVGIGAIGEDLVSLIQASLCFAEVDIADLHELDKIVFNAYIEGLADSGWQGDPRLARLGYAASSVLCFGVGYGGFDYDEAMIHLMEDAVGLPLNQLSVLFANCSRYLVDLADEARTLMGIL